MKPPPPPPALPANMNMMVAGSGGEQQMVEVGHEAGGGGVQMSPLLPLPPPPPKPATPMPPPCVVSRAQFVHRLLRWPWLRTRFETLGGQNHLGFDASFLKRCLGVMYDELSRIQHADEGRVRTLATP
jgi:hypothetical protein